MSSRKFTKEIVKTLFKNNKSDSEDKKADEDKTIIDRIFTIIKYLFQMVVASIIGYYCTNPMLLICIIKYYCIKLYRYIKYQNFVVTSDDDKESFDNQVIENLKTNIKNMSASLSVTATSSSSSSSSSSNSSNSSNSSSSSNTASASPSSNVDSAWNIDLNITGVQVGKSFIVNHDPSSEEHQMIINDSRKKAQDSIDNKHNPIYLEYFTGDLVLVELQSVNSFITRNNKNLIETLKHSIITSNLKKEWKAWILVNDAESGLGKTNSIKQLANYYYELNGARVPLCCRVVYYNMQIVSLTDKEAFAKIVKNIKLFDTKKAPLVICFDEFDKFVNAFCESMYQIEVKSCTDISSKTPKLKSKSSSSASSSANDSEHSEHSDDEYQVIDSSKRIMRNKKSFILSVKEEILIQMKILFDLSVDGAFFIIFNTNNWHTLFEGIDNIHFNALKTRLNYIKFENADKEEIVKFIKFTNKKFEGYDDYYVDEIVLDTILRDINDNISISYTELSRELLLAKNNISDFVKQINGLHTTKKVMTYD